MDRETQRLIDACREAADKMEELWTQLDDREQEIVDLNELVNDYTNELRDVRAELGALQQELDASR